LSCTLARDAVRHLLVLDIADALATAAAAALTTAFAVRGSQRCSQAKDHVPGIHL